LGATASADQARIADRVSAERACFAPGNGPRPVPDVRGCEAELCKGVGVGRSTTSFRVGHAHQADDNGTGSFDDGVTRPPERVVWRLERSATDRLGDVMELVNVVSLIHSHVEDYASEGRIEPAPLLSKHDAVEVDPKGRTLQAVPAMQ
jgi:hypothetical protein